jgi:glutaredoxin-like protein NrdH
MRIIVYTKPDCIQCTFTLNELIRAGIDHAVIDISKNGTAHDYIRSLGYSQLPVIVAGDDHWSGFRIERLRALRQRRSPQRSASAALSGRTKHAD